jgi:hypothetical protein
MGAIKGYLMIVLPTMGPSVSGKGQLGAQVLQALLTESKSFHLPQMLCSEEVKCGAAERELDSVPFSDPKTAPRSPGFLQLLCASVYPSAKWSR